MSKLKEGDMNEAKIRTLNYIGFGSLLDMHLQKQPKSLASWVVDHFDPNKCSIEFPDGRSIEITEVDVFRCFGIPMGTKSVVIKGQSDNKEVISKWRSQYDKQYSRLRPSHVMTKMLSSDDSGLQFIQNFMVLFDSTLVSGQHNGGVSQRLVRSITTVDDLLGVNWCEFVISSLINAKLKYDKERKSSFEGPALFLVLIYLDRVVYQGKRLVPRGMPSFKGWTDNRISTREKCEMESGGFGSGRIDPPLEVTPIEKVKLMTKEEYYNDLVNSAIEVSRKLKEFVDKLNNVPNELREDPPIQCCYELGKTLIGRGYPDGTGLEALELTPAATVLSQETPEFCNDPKFLQNMKMIDDAIKARDELIAEKNKWPTFDLGFGASGGGFKDPVELVISDIRRDDGTCEEEVVGTIPVPRPITTTEGVGDDVLDGQELSIPMQGTKLNEVDGIAASGSIGVESIQNEHQLKGKEAIVSEVEEVSNPCNEDHSKTMDVESSDKGDIGKQFTQVAAQCKGKGVMPGNQVDYTTPRPRRGRTHSIKEVSPFMCRVIDPEARSTKEQTLMVTVLKEMKSEKILFDHLSSREHSLTKFRLTSTDMVALLGQSIPPQVLDVWALRLNHLELFRSKESPYIYFVPPSVTYGSVTHPVDETYNLRSVRFFMRFHESAANGELKVGDLDMMMFSIYENGEYYVICFHFERGVAEILDSSKAREGNNAQHYSTVFIELKRMLCQLLEDEGLPNLAERTNKIKCGKVFDMDWKTAIGGIDSGLYAMRHMETYKGDAKWRCGFKAGSRKNISALRARYAYYILTSDLNDEKKKLVSAFKKGAAYIDGALYNVDEAVTTLNQLPM